jgi:hypothetical protein
MKATFFELQERREQALKEKEDWRAEGQRLGQNASKHAWEIGHWLCRGAELFLGEPSLTNRKERRLWHAQRRENLNAFIAEAADITNLSDSALRQYARVVRNGVRVDGLTFTHHLEVQRVHRFDEKGKRRFDGSAALQILNLAKENTWTVAQTREEVRRQFPATAAIESGVEKAKRLLTDLLDGLDIFEKYDLIEFIQSNLDASDKESEESELF